MQSFFSFLLLLHLVPVWTAPTEVICVPVRVPSVVKEMEVLETLNQLTLKPQTPMDVLKILGGLQPLLPSVTDSGVFSTRLKYNFEKTMKPNTRKNDHTPQETYIRKKYPLNGIDSVVIDADQNALNTEILHNNLRHNDEAFFEPEKRFADDDVIKSIPFIPFQMNVPTKVVSWLVNLILDIIARLGSRDKPKRLYLNLN